jgi:cytoskeletal protein RodZ
MAEIGARLREARLRAKIDINEVEVRTKIRAKYLRAMENDEWDLLPGEVFAKSFLRTYGEFLGLDTRQLIDDFKRLYEHPSDHEVRQIAPRGRERDRKPRGPLIPPWAVVAGVLVAVVVALYFVGVSGNGSSSSTTTTTTQTAAQHKHHSHNGSSATKKHHRTMVKLQLVPTGAVYVCLVNGNGKKLIPGVIYDTGQTVPVQSGRKLLLTLGNASVQMKVNGVPVTVAPSSSAIGYELLPDSHRLLAAGTGPTCS